MADNLTVAMRVTADSKQLVAEVRGAQQAVSQLGPATQQAAQQAATALRQVEVQARSTSTALATVPAQAGGGLARVATSLGGVPGVLTTVATAAGSAGGAFGSLGTVASALSGGLAGLVATVVSLGVQYGVTALSTEKATDAEKKLAEALEFAERRMKTSEQVALDLAFAKRKQALATLEAAKAIQAETLAQLQQDLEFAQSGRISAEELARRPGRVGTQRQMTARTAAENAEGTIRDIGRAAEEAAAALRKTEDAIAAVVSPSRDEAARDARAGGRGTREQGAFDPLRGLRESARRLEAETRTPLEQFQERLDRLNALVRLGPEQGGISIETYRRALQAAETDLNKAGEAAARAEGSTDALADAFRSVAEELNGVSRQTADYLAKAALGVDGVRFSFNKLAETLASGLLSKLIQDQVTGPLTKVLTQLAQAGLTDLGYALGFTSPTPAPGKIVNLDGGVKGSLLHAGGIAGREAPMGLRALPAEIFASAPRFHSGMPWLMPNEVPAVLRRGEGVFTEGQMKALAPARGGSVTVVVNDYRTNGGEPVQVSERQDGDGRRVVEVTILDTVARGIATGQLDRAARQAWGVTRKGS